MGKTFLITGGAGFIGSHLADELLRDGHRVRVLDNLDAQVHGPDAERPDYLAPEIELIKGDMRDPQKVAEALHGVDAVFHLAAAVGVGQSMYEIRRYTDINNMGTATLLEALPRANVERLVVASSMSLYGEGLYRNIQGEPISNARRSREQLLRGQWEPQDAQGQSLQPMPTPESKAPELTSVYALGKYDQERLCLILGEAYNIPTTALRLFNVYGPRQALSNPYTGVLAIFAARYLNDRPPLIFEDGNQRRDFVSVHDVARAFYLAYQSPQAAGEVINIGGGVDYSVAEIAARMGDALGKSHIEAEITGRYRVGDIRHCYADLTKARELLGYVPNIELEAGLIELAGYLASATAVDHSSRAHEELATHGLTL